MKYKGIRLKIEREESKKVELHLLLKPLVLTVEERNTLKRLVSDKIRYYEQSKNKYSKMKAYFASMIEKLDGIWSKLDNI